MLVTAWLAIVVGSAVVDRIARRGAEPTLVADVSAFVEELAAAIKPDRPAAAPSAVSWQPR